MKDDRFYKIQYRVRCLNFESDWQLLVIEQESYVSCVQAPCPQTALHWRAVEIGEAVRKIKSDICRIIDLRATEIAVSEAMESHRKFCKRCLCDEECWAASQLISKMEADSNFNRER